MSDTLRVSNIYAGSAVGIGKTPAYALDVVGSINLTGSLLSNGSTFTTSQWTTTGSNVYYNTGSVGIGTNNPTAALTIAGTQQLISPAYHTQQLLLTGNEFYTAATSSTGIGINIGVNRSTNKQLWIMDPDMAINGTNGAFRAWIMNGSVIIDATSTDGLGTVPLRVQGNPLLLNSGGNNVGIGKTNPAYALDVSGSVNVTGSFYVNGVAFSGSSQWTTNGSVINYTTGNVGIGTTNPSSKLQVYADGISMGNEGATHSMTILSSQGTSGTNQMMMLLDADYTNQCSSIQSIVNGLKVWNLCLNPRGGNVGIGLTNPGDTLSVSASGWSTVGINASSAANSAATIYRPFGTTSSSNPQWFVGEKYNAHGPLSIWNYDGSSHLPNAITITPTGSVGIGTTVPQGTLHVHTANQWPYGSVFSNASNANHQLVIGTYWTGTAGTSYSALQSVTQGAANNNLVLNPFSGNVGIGITNPSSALHVNGAAIITGSLSVNGSAVPVSAGSVWATGSAGSISYGSGMVNITAGSKITVQSAVDGGNANGIYYWMNTDTNWVGYMGQSGAGRSASGGTACTGAFGFTAHALRNRVTNATTQGFIWENLAETCLMSIRGDGVGGGVMGSWGVGTVSPNASVHIYNTSGDRTTSLNVETMRAGIQLKSTGASGGNFNIWSSLTGETPGAGALCFYDNTNTSFRMVINASGYVGVGTAVPAAPLDIQGYIQIGSGGTNSYDGITFTRGTTSNSYPFIRCQTNYIGMYVSNAGGWASDSLVGDMVLRTFANAIRFNTINGTTSSMVITGTGNVGIGTTTPSSVLSVYSSSTSKFALEMLVAGEAYGFSSSAKSTYSTAGTVGVIASLANSTTNGCLIDMLAYNSSNGATNIFYGAVAGATSNAAANFVIGRRTGGTSWAESMRIDTSGQVGIGTNAPNNQLQVSSNGVTPVEINRFGASDGWGSGIIHTLTSNSGAFRGIYAKTFGGSNGTIATTLQSQANGYYCIDLANAGVFATDSVTSNSTLYMTNSQALFNVNINIGGAMAGQGPLAIKNTSVSNVSQYIQHATNGNWPIWIQFGVTGYTGSANFMLFQDASGNQRGSIASSAQNTISYNVGSDARIKHNIQDLTNVRSMIERFRPRRFELNNDPHNIEHHGFIAQEVLTEFPHLVTLETPETNIMMLDYGKFSPYGIAGVQDLYKENDALRARVQSLETQVASQESRLAAVEALLAKLAPSS